MDCKTISLSRLETSLRLTLDECVTSGTPVIVELPGDRRVVLQPITVVPDDDLADRLIANNAAFREMLARSAASGSVPFDFELEPE